MGILRCARPHTWSVLNLGARTVIHEIYMNIPLGNMTLYPTKIEFPPVSCALPWVQACMAIVRTSSETGWTRHLGTLLLSGASCSSEACALRSPLVAIVPRRSDAVGSQEVFESYTRYNISLPLKRSLFVRISFKKTRDDSHFLGHLLSATMWLGESTHVTAPV